MNRMDGPNQSREKNAFGVEAKLCAYPVYETCIRDVQRQIQHMKPKRTPIAEMERE